MVLLAGSAAILFEGGVVGGGEGSKTHGMDVSRVVLNPLPGWCADALQEKTNGKGVEHAPAT